VKLRDYFRFRRNSRALVEWSGVMHLMSDALRLDVAEEEFGGWIRAMPIFRDCPKRLPAMLSAHLSSLVLSPHENLMANPVRRDSLFIVEKGLIAHRGKIQETGALLGMERIYKAQSELLESSPPAVTLCHAVVLCLRRDALLGVVAEFPETQKQMRNIVCRLIMRETVVAYARAIVQSVRVSSSSMTEAGGSGGTKKAPPGGSVQVIRFMLGEHLDDSLSDMAEKHRLHLMARERPDEFDRMERAVLYVQRVYRGHVTRRALRAVLLTAEGSERGVTPGTKAMFQVLFNLRLHKHAEEFREIGLERRHLAATSALELCQVTSLPFADAADVILLARQLENENPMVSDRKSDRKSSRRGHPADAVSDDFRPAVPAATASKNAHPKKRDNVQITSESSRFSKHQSSKEVFAARAFAKPEDRLGLTVLLAAAKFREGGARRRARRG
jgi:ribosomal protein L34E